MLTVCALFRVSKSAPGASTKPMMVLSNVPAMAHRTLRDHLVVEDAEVSQNWLENGMMTTMVYGSMLFFAKVTPLFGFSAPS